MTEHYTADPEYGCGLLMIVVGILVALVLAFGLGVIVGVLFL